MNVLLKENLTIRCFGQVREHKRKVRKDAKKKDHSKSECRNDVSLEG